MWYNKRKEVIKCKKIHVDENIYEKFKQYCKKNNTTIQYELSSLFDTLWTNIEMGENLNFQEGGEI